MRAGDVVVEPWRDTEEDDTFSVEVENGDVGPSESGEVFGDSCDICLWRTCSLWRMARVLVSFTMGKSLLSVAVVVVVVVVDVLKSPREQRGL